MPPASRNGRRTRCRPDRAWQRERRAARRPRRAVNVAIIPRRASASLPRPHCKSQPSRSDSRPHARIAWSPRNAPTRVPARGIHVAQHPFVFRWVPASGSRHSGAGSAGTTALRVLLRPAFAGTTALRCSTIISCRRLRVLRGVRDADCRERRSILAALHRAAHFAHSSPGARLAICSSRCRCHATQPLRHCAREPAPRLCGPTASLLQG